MFDNPTPGLFDVIPHGTARYQAGVARTVRMPLPLTVYVAGPGLLPSRSHADDAGFDLHCYLSQPIHLRPGERANVPCGISIEIPASLFGWITPRSSALGHGLHVVAGVIDPGYRGELFTRVQNINPLGEEGDGEVTIRHGERIAQLILLPNVATTVSMVGVETLTPSVRGSNGFGSTGR